MASTHLTGVNFLESVNFDLVFTREVLDGKGLCPQGQRKGQHQFLQTPSLLRCLLLWHSDQSSVYKC